MKTEMLKELDLNEDQIKAVFAENGKDIEKSKSNLANLEAQLKEARENLSIMTEELKNLQDNKATAEDYKLKFEQLQSDIAAREEQTKADRLAQEKEAAISNRFNSLLGEKQFSHEAIKNDYLRKFAGALENENFVGKSDRDIFHELTRDDAGAFLGVQAVRLEGSADFAANDIDEAQIRSVMGLPPLK